VLWARDVSSLETAERLLVRFANPPRLIARLQNHVNKKVDFIFGNILKIDFLFVFI
jgi:hypothetical protein